MWLSRRKVIRPGIKRPDNSHEIRHTTSVVCTVKRGIFETIFKGDKPCPILRQATATEHYHLRQFTNSTPILSFTAGHGPPRGIEAAGVYPRREISGKRRTETNIPRALRLRRYILSRRNRRKLRRREKGHGVGGFQEDSRRYLRLLGEIDIVRSSGLSSGKYNGALARIARLRCAQR